MWYFLKKPATKVNIIACEKNNALLWKTSDGSEVGVFRGHKRGIWKVQFSPMDQVLGTASADGMIKLWTLNTFTCFKTFEGHDSSILNLMFLSKGTQLLSSGSDGLLKLWNMKGNECICTLDGHDDKIWGLAATNDESMIATVSADSNIILWEDVTEREDTEKKKNNELIILRHQELQNLINEKNFVKALSLAITLEQPFTALKIVKEILHVDCDRTALEETINKMRDDQKNVLLKFIMSWNTNARNCHEAHAILHFIIKDTSPSDLMNFSNIQEALQALLPYSEKHFDRVSRLNQQATFVDFMLQSIKIKPMNEMPTQPKPSSTVQKSTKPLFQIDIRGSNNENGTLANEENMETVTVEQVSDTESSDDESAGELQQTNDTNQAEQSETDNVLSQNSIPTISSGTEEDLGSDGDISVKKQRLTLKKNKSTSLVKGKGVPRRTAQRRTAQRKRVL